MTFVLSDIVLSMWLTGLYGAIAEHREYETNPLWHIASETLFIIGLVISLWPVPSQTVAWTNYELSSIAPLEVSFSKVLIEIQ